MAHPLDRHRPYGCKLSGGKVRRMMIKHGLGALASDGKHPPMARATRRAGGREGKSALTGFGIDLEMPAVFGGIPDPPTIE